MEMDQQEARDMTDEELREELDRLLEEIGDLRVLRDEAIVRANKEFAKAQEGIEHLEDRLAESLDRIQKIRDGFVNR